MANGLSPIPPSGVLTQRGISNYEYHTFSRKAFVVRMLADMMFTAGRGNCHLGCYWYVVGSKKLIRNKTDRILQG